MNSGVSKMTTTTEEGIGSLYWKDDTDNKLLKVLYVELKKDWRGRVNLKLDLEDNSTVRATIKS